jgi:hypothetical protein
MATRTGAVIGVISLPVTGATGLAGMEERKVPGAAGAGGGLPALPITFGATGELGPLAGIWHPAKAVSAKVLKKSPSRMGKTPLYMNA